MTKIFMVKQGSHLVAAAQVWEDELAKIPEGKEIEVKISSPRKVKHNSLYWALMAKLVDNQDQYTSAEELSNDIKIALGHCETTTYTRGDTTIVTHRPKSIAFSKMDQLEFNEFFKGVVRVVCNRILPHMEEEALQNEILQMLGN